MVLFDFMIYSCCIVLFLYIAYRHIIQITDDYSDEEIYRQNHLKILQAFGEQQKIKELKKQEIKNALKSRI